MTRASQRRRNRAFASVAVLSAFLLLGGGLAYALGGEDDAGVPTAGCAGDRTVVVGATSSERNPERLGEVSEVVSRELAAAAVCDEPISIVAVSGGTSRPMSSDEVLHHLNLDRGPTRAREHRLESKGNDLRAAVRTFLEDTLRALDGHTSSIPRLFAVAAEHTDPTGRILILTDGVQNADGIDLDRVLAPGEGSTLARSIGVAALRGESRVVIAGVGQTDASTPAPGATWIGEVRDFVSTLCEAAASRDRCTVLTSGGPDEIAAA